MTVGEFEPEASAPASRYTGMWFLKRLLLGTAILVISMGGLAWLTHAAIEPAAVEGETILDTISGLTNSM